MLLLICVLALYSGKYRLVGCMIAVYLTHGGVEPQFFSRRLYNQVCGLPPPEPDITDSGLLIQGNAQSTSEFHR